MPVVGTAPVKPCPQCQFRNKSSATFCQKCGQNLAAAQAPQSYQPIARSTVIPPVNASMATPTTKPIAPTSIQISPNSAMSMPQPNRQQLLAQLQMFAYGLIGLGAIILVGLIFGPFVKGGLSGELGGFLGGGVEIGGSAIHLLLLLLATLFEAGLSNGGIIVFFVIIIILLLPIYAIFAITSGSKLIKAITLNQMPYSIQNLQIFSGIMTGFFGLIYALTNIQFKTTSNGLGGFGAEAGIGLGWGFTLSLFAMLGIFIGCIWYKNIVLKLSVNP